MTTDPLRIGLTTLIETATLLGSPLEDRSALRLAQDPVLGERVLEASQTTLATAEGAHCFSFGCVDFLVEDTPEGRLFYPIEFNGTGTGGITNISAQAFGELEDQLSQLAVVLPDQNPLVLMPYYHPSRLIFEKILLSQAIKEGFQSRLGQGQIVGLDDYLAHPDWYSGPTVVIASLKALMGLLALVPGSGALTLEDRPVTASFHDVFCQNMLNQFEHRVDLSTFLPVNGFYQICSDKTLVNHYFNQYLTAHPFPLLPRHIGYETAPDEEALITTLLRRLDEGKKTVIKPHGGGVGTGIEFFMAPEPENSLRKRVQESVQAMSKTYGTVANAYPYTVCDFINAATIQQSGHPLRGHKYELRIVVYRHGKTVRAFPTHVKISSEHYDPAINSRNMLMNNHVGGSDPRHSAMFRVPLCSEATLATLDISREQLTEVCRFSTGFVSYVIQQFIEQPQCFESSSSYRTGISPA